MITMQRMRDWQKWVLVPIFVLICISFGASASLTDFLRLGNDRPIGEIMQKKVLRTEYWRAQEELFLLRRFYAFSQQVFNTPFLMADPEVAFALYSMNSNRMRGGQDPDALNYAVLLTNGFTMPQGEEDDVWSYIVYQRTGTAWGLSVSQEDVANRIRGAFVSNGQNNLETFRMMLKQLNTTEPLFVEAFQRFMVVERMCKLAMNAAVPSKMDAYNAYCQREDQRKFGYIVFDPETYKKDIQFKDEDLEAFYRMKKHSLYKEPRKIRLRIAEIPHDALRADVRLSDAETRDYYDRYKQHLYVKERKPDATNPDGSVTAGEVVYFAFDEVKDKVKANLQGESLPEHAGTLAADLHGELTKWLEARKPVVDEEIKKEEEARREEEKKAREAATEKPAENADGNAPVESQPAPLLAARPDPDAIKQTSNRYIIITEAELQKLYGDKVKIVDTGFFNPLDAKLNETEELKPYFGDAFQRQAKALVETEISTAVTAAGRTFVFQILETRSAGSLQYADIKDRVKEDCVSDKAKTLADDACKTMYASIKDDYTIVKLAEEHKLNLIYTDWVKNPQFYADDVKLEGIDTAEESDFYRQVFGANENVTLPVTGKKASFLFVVTAVKHPRFSDVPEDDITRGLSGSKRRAQMVNLQKIRSMVMDGTQQKLYKEEAPTPEIGTADSSTKKPAPEKPKVKINPKKEEKK